MVLHMFLDFGAVKILTLIKLQIFLIDTTVQGNNNFSVIGTK